MTHNSLMEFIGREKELRVLAEALQSKESSFLPVYGLPTLVVIGPQGEVVFHNVGVTSASRLAKAIKDAAAG